MTQHISQYLKKFKTTEDLMNSFKPQNVRCVEVDGVKWIEIKHENEDFQAHSRYEIELDRIADLQGVLSWAYHLSEKMWVTTKILREFMQVASSNLNINLHLMR